MGSLTNGSLFLDLKVKFSFVRLLSIDDVCSIKGCGSKNDIGLHGFGVLTTIPNIGNGLVSDNHASALSILKEYADLFFTGPCCFSLLKRTLQQLDLEDVQLFWVQSYWELKLKEAQVAIKIKKLFKAGLLKLSKKPVKFASIFLRRIMVDIVSSLTTKAEINQKEGYLPPPLYWILPLSVGSLKIFLHNESRLYLLEDQSLSVWLWKTCSYL